MQDTEQAGLNPDSETRNASIVYNSQSLLKLLANHDEIKHLIYENTELNMQLNQLNSLLNDISYTIDQSKDQKSKIYSKFPTVINEAETNTIFKLKTHSLIDTLHQNQVELQYYLDENPELNVQFNDLNTHLNELLNKIKCMNEQSFYFSLLQEEDRPTDSIILEISEIMNNINLALQNIGVQNPTKLPSDKFYQDFLQIYDSLDNKINVFEKRKKEVMTILNNCKNNFVNLSKESIDQILDHYDKYRLEKSLFKKGSLLYYSYEPFEYYNGIQKVDLTPVILMKLKENKYLSRILEILTQLDHSCVESFIGFYDENENDDYDDDDDEDENEDKEPSIVIVTKRVGVDLFSFLHSMEKPKQAMKLEPGDLTILAYKIAQGMSYVHSRNIMHRNLTTSSVYLNKEKGKEIETTIVGFRSARTIQNRVLQDLTLRKGCIFEINPSNFFAPEHDSSQYDEKIDVFSFAGILYELATGDQPYGDLDDKETSRKLTDGERPEFTEKVSEGLADLINHCWAQEPSERYSFNQVMEEMAKNTIIVDQDLNEDQIEEISKFYEKNTNNRGKINFAIEILENTKKDIVNAYQYKHILFSTRSLLNRFQSFLAHEYKSKNNKDKDENSNSNDDTENANSNDDAENNKENEENANSNDDAENNKENEENANSNDDTENANSNDDAENNKENEENDKMDDLIINLQQFSSLVSKTLYDNWISMADTLPVNKIVDDTNDCMQKIKESIKVLGFQGNESYQESKDDLIYDFRELYMTFENDKEHFKSPLSNEKRKEVVKYLKAKDPNWLKEIKNPSMPQVYQRIIDLFGQFSQHEKNFNDFTKSFEVQRGKNSTVYEGYYEGTPVAIKVFNGNELGKSEKNLFNLRREIEYLTKVKHKNIAEFVGYAINKKNNDVWIATKLAKSGSMRQMLKDEMKNLSDFDKTKIAFELAEAMRYLNSQQIVHRGLTSSNIVIEGNEPKIIDFGNASPDIKGVDRNEYDNTTLDNVEYDTKDDIFAFSAILYEMLQGEAPRGPNYRFNIDEKNKNDLHKLIESGFQPANQSRKYRNFDQIINTMDHQCIRFPESNYDEIVKFYQNKREEKNKF